MTTPVQAKGSRGAKDSVDTEYTYHGSLVLAIHLQRPPKSNQVIHVPLSTLWVSWTTQTRGCRYQFVEEERGQWQTFLAKLLSNRYKSTIGGHSSGPYKTTRENWRGLVKALVFVEIDSGEIPRLKLKRREGIVGDRSKSHMARY